ncbi:PREDICTED: uncharacterized protein LOC108765211 [Trachymyrmex cornetzi]|uniref:uncharacterized protein LOC108765211 n=1 Tax=Trachymyrmex cornetzi TaxID=471704 RepID=UPI00084F560F|nr:PREDICTED: uncharacterized protein LOC108765211 [Trachymyrmex cornetzi]
MATMDKEQFIKLVKHSRREPISPEHRLVITLFYLSQGCSMQVVAWSFLIGKAIASIIIKETCEAIWDVLNPIYCKQPTVEEWKEKADEFDKQWNLPNCCGAIDGKYITIQTLERTARKVMVQCSQNQLSDKNWNPVG